MTDKNFMFKLGAIVLLSISLAMSVSADWPMFHHDIQQTGYIEESSALGENHTIWNFSATLSHSSPVITDGKVIITSVKDNQIYALSESNGSKIWNKSVPNLAWSYSSGGINFYFSFTPAVVGDMIYVGAGDCKIYALNLSNGNQLWNFTGNGRTASFLTVANNGVIFRCHRDGNTNDTLYTLDASNGDKTFEKNFSYFSAKTISPAVSAVNGLVYTEVYRCMMSAINLSNGNIEWNFTVTEGCGSVGLSPPVLVNDKLIFGTDMGYVYFVNTTTKDFNKTYLYGEYIASKMAPAIWKDMAFIGTGIRGRGTYGNFYAINLTNYSVAWKYPVGDAIQSAPAVADGKVFFLAENNKFYALNASNGVVNWSYATPNVGWIENDMYTSSPAISDGVVTIGVPEGKVHAFKTIQLVFVKVVWDNNVNFTNIVNQHANYFLERSGLNACGMRVEIKIVNGSPNITGQEICDVWNNSDISPILEGIKDWALTNNIRGDRYIGLTTYNMTNDCNVGGYTTLIPNIHYDTVIAQYDDRALTSHEIGHSYGLCDEYCYNGTNYNLICWLEQNNSLAMLSGCPNPYPCDAYHTCTCDHAGEYVCEVGQCRNNQFYWFDDNYTFSCANRCNCNGVFNTIPCSVGVCHNNNLCRGPSSSCENVTPFDCGEYCVNASDASLFITTGNYNCNGQEFTLAQIGQCDNNMFECFAECGQCHGGNCLIVTDTDNNNIVDGCWLYNGTCHLGIDCNSYQRPQAACNSSNCANRWPCNNGNGTYDAAIGVCRNNSFFCYGYKFNDDTFSIMGYGNAVKSNYTAESITHLNNILCKNKGFIVLPPLTTYSGTSGAAASKYISKSTNQKDSNYLKVRFVVRKDGTGSFKDVEILKDGQIADVPKGDYSIVLKNNKREPLYTKSFGVSFVAMGNPPKKYNETSITYTIPYVNGAKSMEIRKGNKVLFSTSIPIINNGGFETGNFNGWVAGGPGDHKVDTQVPYTAKYSTLIGFRDHSNVANGYDYIYQTIEVPLGKESELSSYYRFYSYDYCNYDFFTMYIKDEKGNVLATPVNRCLGGNGLEDTGWTKVKYNLTPYAGQKIQIYFEVSNRYDTWGQSWAYIDDVAVTSISQLTNNGFETGNLTGWNVGGDGCYPNWVTIVNSSAKPGLVRTGNYSAVGNAAWTGSYSNSWCATGWYCPEDAILTKQIKVPTYNITGGIYVDFFTMIQTGSQWQSQVRVTVKDLTTGEVIYAKGNGAYSGYYGLECPPGNCNGGQGNGCTEPNDNWQYHHASLNDRENHTIELQFRSHSCCWCSLFYVDDVCIADKDGACL